MKKIRKLIQQKGLSLELPGWSVKRKKRKKMEVTILDHPEGPRIGIYRVPGGEIFYMISPTLSYSAGRGEIIFGATSYRENLFMNAFSQAVSMGPLHLLFQDKEIQDLNPLKMALFFHYSLPWGNRNVNQSRFFKKDVLFLRFEKTLRYFYIDELKKPAASFSREDLREILEKNLFTKNGKLKNIFNTVFTFPGIFSISTTVDSMDIPAHKERKSFLNLWKEYFFWRPIFEEIEMDPELLKLFTSPRIFDVIDDGTPKSIIARSEGIVWMFLEK